MTRSQSPRSDLCACLLVLVLVASAGCQGPATSYGEYVQVRPPPHRRPAIAGAGASESGAGGVAGSAGDVSLAGTSGTAGAGVQVVPVDAQVPVGELDAAVVDEPDAEIDAGEPPVVVPAGFCPATRKQLLVPSAEGDGTISGCPERICTGKAWREELDLETFFEMNEDPISAVEYEDCTRVTGDVLITKEQASDLRALHCLERVDGTFMIWNGGALTSLDGLDALHYVGGDLRISRLPPYLPLVNSITEVDGLSNLRAVGGSLSIHMPKVTNLDGLRRLTAVGVNLEIEEPTALLDLTGLEDLQAIGRSLRIVAANDRPVSMSLRGLDLLESIGGSVDIMGGVSYSAFDQVLPHVSCLGGGVAIPGPNDNLETIDLMPNVKRIGGSIVISGNPALRFITLLQGVEHVHGSIQISGNGMLEEVSVNVLQQVDGNILVVGNPRLPDCPLIQLASSIGANHAEIHDNLPTWFGCVP